MKLSWQDNKKGIQIEVVTIWEEALIVLEEEEAIVKVEDLTLLL